MRLALDLGTTTGFAYEASGAIAYGSWKLKPKKDVTDAQRFQALTHHLTALPVVPSVVYYEDVRRHRGNLAARVYAGLLATLQVWAHDHGVPLVPVGVRQIKKFWTRNGAASKDEMIQEAIYRGFEPADDNEADALALLHYGLAGKPYPILLSADELRTFANNTGEITCSSSKTTRTNLHSTISKRSASAKRRTAKKRPNFTPARCSRPASHI